MAKGIIYLKKNQCLVFEPTLPRIISIDFPQSSVANMDVLSPDELKKAITTAFTTNKIITPSSYTIILGKEILFLKEFERFDLKVPVVKAIPEQKTEDAGGQVPPGVTDHPSPKPEMTVVERENAKGEQDKAIQSFIEHVPFEDVGSKVLTMPKTLLVVAANEELYTVIKDALHKMGHTVDSVLPEVLFGEAHLENGLTLDSARLLLTKVDSFRQDNFLHERVDTTPKLINNTPANPKKEKQRTIALIGVFVFLFLFMIILYFVMYMQPKPKKALQTPAILPTFTPAVTKTPESEVGSSSAAFSTLNVQILSKTISNTEASSIKSSLSALGITDITISQQTSVAPAKTLIVFSSDIPADERTTLVDAIQKTVSSVTSQENTSGKNTVTITLGSQ